MDSGINHRLSKKIVFDPEFELDRICWVLETVCPVCNEPLEVVFDEHPSEIEILEAEQIPCDDCLKETETDEEMSAIIKELFERDHPYRKT
jgi:uncharacterized protein with PIN domain